MSVIDDLYLKREEFYLWLKFFRERMYSCGAGDEYEKYMSEYGNQIAESLTQAGMLLEKFGYR